MHKNNTKGKYWKVGWYLSYIVTWNPTFLLPQIKLLPNCENKNSCHIKELVILKRNEHNYIRDNTLREVNLIKFTAVTNESLWGVGKKNEEEKEK